MTISGAELNEKMFMEYWNKLMKSRRDETERLIREYFEKEFGIIDYELKWTVM